MSPVRSRPVEGCRRVCPPLRGAGGWGPRPRVPRCGGRSRGRRCGRNAGRGTDRWSRRVRGGSGRWRSGRARVGRRRRGGRWQRRGRRAGGPGRRKGRRGCRAARARHRAALACWDGGEGGGDGGMVVVRGEVAVQVAAEGVCRGISPCCGAHWEEAVRVDRLGAHRNPVRGGLEHARQKERRVVVADYD